MAMMNLPPMQPSVERAAGVSGAVQGHLAADEPGTANDHGFDNNTDDGALIDCRALIAANGAQVINCFIAAAARLFDNDGVMQQWRSASRGDVPMLLL
jgi:hypothetical protein